MPVKPGETWATMLDDIALDGIRLRFEQPGSSGRHNGRTMKADFQNDDVRFGSLADIAAALPNVRFTPESRHSRTRQ